MDPSKNGNKKLTLRAIDKVSPSQYRDQTFDPSRAKKRGKPSGKAPRSDPKKRKAVIKKPAVQEESSDDDLDEEEGGNSVFDGSDDDEKPDSAEEEEDIDSDEEHKTETAADKRRRLAKMYLSNLQDDAETEEFDAKDLDNDIIASRLQKDIAEQKGYVYKYYGDRLVLEGIDPNINRMAAMGLTSVAAKYPNVYTTSKDMELTKWDVRNLGKKPLKAKFVKGGPKYREVSKEQANNGHSDEILTIAASPDGKFVATGGRDKRIIVWSSENLAPIRVLETRDRRGEVMGLAFRRGTDQLYAACADLKIRTYSVNQLAQLETLYGHQDLVVDIAALAQERCVTVGSRDRTAMLWKISEETRLTFRGGDFSEKKSAKKQHQSTTGDEEEKAFYAEGSIDCVSMIDDSHFVTGSDNGNISLWSLAKKKPLYTERQAHGVEEELPASRASAESPVAEAEKQVPRPQPFWITSVHAIPYSDLFFSGSWNGEIKVWKLEKELRSFKLVTVLPKARGIVTKIDAIEDEENSRLRVFASLSKEHRLGRWIKSPVGSRNALYSCLINLHE